ncbi:hypothetical protein H9P43_000179 [Blastocladiella emersonii ATCC 22665]|nr:hypothetical protein H9P43_000179 [Blastocladiella emersonii ATCC 22665]
MTETPHPASYEAAKQEPELERALGKTPKLEYDQLLHKEDVLVDDEETSIDVRDQVVDPAHDGGLWAWLVVLSSFLVHVVVLSIQYSFGAYVPYFQDTIFKGRVTSAEVVLIGTIGFTCIVALGVLSGKIAEVYGYRQTMLAGSVILATGLVLAAHSTELWQFMLTQGFLVGVGGSLAYYPAIAIPSQWWSKRQSLATGIAWTLLVTAACAFMLLSVAFAFLQPRIPHLRRTLSEVMRALVDFSQFKNPQFVPLLVGVFLNPFAYLLPFYFAPSYVQHIGLDRSWSPLLLNIINAMSIVGRIVGGAVADRFGNINSLFVTIFTESVSCIGIWMWSATPGMLIYFAVFFGLAGGGFMSLMPSVTAQVCGVQNHAATIDLVYMALSVGQLSARHDPIAGAIKSPKLDNELLLLHELNTPDAVVIEDEEASITVFGPYVDAAPDGGFWAWLVVASSFLAHVVVDAVSGAGFGALGIVPATDTMLTSFGLKWTLLVTGASAFMLLSLAVALLETRVPHRRRHPSEVMRSFVDFSQFANPQFVPLLVGVFVNQFAYLLPFYFVPSYVQYLGLDHSWGPSLLDLINGTSIVGRIAGGALADRFGNVNSLLTRRMPSTTTLVALASLFALVLLASVTVEARFPPKSEWCIKAACPDPPADLLKSWIEQETKVLGTARVCGDGICNVAEGESCGNCAADCGRCTMLAPINRCVKEGTIALTFDDGVSPYTEELVKTLNGLGIKATFFMVGATIVNNPGLHAAMKSVVDSGHEIGIHGFSHRSYGAGGRVDPPTDKSKTMDNIMVRTETVFTDLAIQSVIGRRPTYIRLPYLEWAPDSLAMLETMGYTVAGVNIDSDDWRWQVEADVDKLVASITSAYHAARVRDSSFLVLQHDTFQYSTKAVPAIVAFLKHQNLRAVTMSECLGVPAYRADGESPFLHRRLATGPLAGNSTAATARAQANATMTVVPTASTSVGPSSAAAAMPTAGVSIQTSSSAATRAVSHVALLTAVAAILLGF